MHFSKLRHRIIFLKSLKTNINTIGENVPLYIPFKPRLNNNLNIIDDDVYLTYDNLGNAVFVLKDGKPFAHQLVINEYSVAASVEPLTGKEYQEAQKIRAETTYKVTTRYFPNITSDMRILFKNKELYIQSVLNIGEKNVELQIICTENDKKTAQDYVNG